MSYFKGKNKEFSFRDLIYKALIFIGTVGVIVYFLPRDGKFNYQFDIDKPWKYGQLMATFDFPIYKDDQVVKREQDSIFGFFPTLFPTGQEHRKRSDQEAEKRLPDAFAGCPALYRLHPPYRENTLRGVPGRDTLHRRTGATAQGQHIRHHGDKRQARQPTGHRQTLFRQAGV